MVTKRFFLSYLSFVFLVFSVISCSNADKTGKILTVVKQMVEQYPDSALILLDSIPNPYRLNDKEQNPYWLLRIQAKDKLYKDITSDTIIFDVRDYYIRKKDFQSAALAAFYCGRVLHEQKNTDKAVYAYLEAEELADKIENDNLKGLIQGNLGILYWEHSLYEKAIASNKRAVKMYDKAKNYKNKISAIHLIGNCFLLNKQIDSAFFYYNESLKLADSYNIPEFQSCVRQNMGVAYEEEGNYKDAKKFFNKALSFPVDSVNQARILLNLAQVFILEDKTDSVKFYLDKALALQVKNPWLKRSTYLLRSKVEEKDKNYSEALKSYKEYYNSTMEVFDNENNNKLLELQEKYDFEKIKNSNDQLTIKHQRIQILLILSLLSTGLVIFLFYWKSVRNKNLMMDLEEKITELQRMAAIVSKENHTFRSIAFNQFNIITKATALKNELSKKEMETESTQWLLKRFNKILYGQDSFDWNNIYQLMNDLQNDLYKKIKGKYPQLTEPEFRILCLSCENVNDTEIAIILDETIPMVRKIRNQIRAKLKMPKYTHDYISFFKGNTELMG